MSKEQQVQISVQDNQEQTNKINSTNENNTNSESSDKSQQNEKNNSKIQDLNQPQQQSKKPLKKSHKIIIIISATIFILLALFFFLSWYFTGNIFLKIYTDDDPVFGGYDVVEYHNLDKFEKGIEGKEENEYIYDNAVFWFKNQENKNKFIANPEKYAPKMGGFCVYGIKSDNGDHWKADWLGPPCDYEHGWYIYKGLLYCNAAQKYSENFFEETDPEANLKIVEGLWKKWFNSLDSKSGYFNNRCYHTNYVYCQRNQLDFGQN